MMYNSSIQLFFPYSFKQLKFEIIAKLRSLKLFKCKKTEEKEKTNIVDTLRFFLASSLEV